ncbi:MAG: hypothetical protein K2W96_12460, partial [Gemmataceae bacterium]|nr:hypothetical protein [Gemmataceae bacterium]
EQCLKPDLADRPPSAVEVYLRLQEVGKASGILLLPPGAMDRLVAARKQEAPTEQYSPPVSRRWLLGGAVALLALLAAGLWWWLSDPTPEAGPASLLGVRIGDDVAEAQGKIGAANIHPGNPWSKECLADLGHALSRDDLRLTAEDWGRTETRWSSDRKSAIISAGGKVAAVVTTSGGTGRGVRVGSDLNRVARLYQESAEEKGFDAPDGHHYQIRRYPSLGLAFEVRGKTVHRITLYPPKAP